MPTWETLLSGVVVAGRYQVLRPLARGGFGAVYVAEHLATERQVALKVLWPHVLENKSAREQFALEARVAGRIASENVVQILDAGLDEQHDLTYLVMELLAGQNLEDVVQERGPLPLEVALEYLRQTAAALDKAHRHVDKQGRRAPIVHRDLKPDNLFLTQREDGTPLIKVLDFGIAKVLSASTHMSADVKGTPLYMAFEQASHGAISPATDIWSFGLVAFYLLTGRSYWRSANSPEGSMTQLFGEVLTLPLSPPSLRSRELGIPATLPPGFDAWFSRCVHRDQSERFQSIAESMRALFECCGVEPGVVAHVAPQAAAPAMAVSGAELAVTAVAPSSGLETQTLAATMVAAGSDSRAPRRSENRASRRRLAIALLALAAVGAAVATVASLRSRKSLEAEVPATVTSVAVPSALGVGAREPSAQPQASAAATVAVTPAVSSVPTAPVAPVAPASQTARPAVARPASRVRRPAAEDVYSDR